MNNRLYLPRVIQAIAYYCDQNEYDHGEICSGIIIDVGKESLKKFCKELRNFVSEYYPDLVKILDDAKVLEERAYNGYQLVIFFEGKI